MSTKRKDKGTQSVLAASLAVGAQKHYSPGSSL